MTTAQVNPKPWSQSLVNDCVHTARLAQRDILEFEVFGVSELDLEEFEQRAISLGKLAEKQIQSLTLQTNQQQDSEQSKLLFNLTMLIDQLAELRQIGRNVWDGRNYEFYNDYKQEAPAQSTETSPDTESSNEQYDTLKSTYIQQLLAQQKAA